MSIQRYDVGGWEFEIDPDANGKYVLFEDHERELSAASAELAQLRDWKAQQLEVESTGDLHKLADLMGAKAGDRVRQFVCERGAEIVKERDAALARVKELESTCSDWLKTCATMRDRVSDIDRQLTEARKDSEQVSYALVKLDAIYRDGIDEGERPDWLKHSLKTAHRINSARKEQA